MIYKDKTYSVFAPRLENGVIKFVIDISICEEKTLEGEYTLYGSDDQVVMRGWWEGPYCVEGASEVTLDLSCQYGDSREYIKHKSNWIQLA